MINKLKKVETWYCVSSLPIVEPAIRFIETNPKTYKIVI